LLVASLVAALAQVRKGRNTYRSLLRYLSVLLDDGVDVNTLGKSLVSTRNSDSKETDDDDPRSEGYVYAEFKHVVLWSSLASLVRHDPIIDGDESGYYAKDSFAEGDLQKYQNKRMVEVTKGAIGGMVEALYMLRCKGLDSSVGMAVKRKKYRGIEGKEHDGVKDVDVCRGRGGRKWARVGFEKSRSLGKAWDGMWARNMLEFMSEEGKKRVAFVLMGLRRFGVDGDVGEIIVGMVMGMEGDMGKYFR